MLVSNWPNAIAHVDADCFYASCELLRRPDLKDKPLCVLSSQDACIVAKTYDAKAAGIKTGMTVWDAKKLLPDAVFLSADFRYYGQISDKLFATLRRYSPVVEEYSIDEAFLDMSGLRSLYKKSYEQLADEIRAVVQQEVGITVSVGISVTRTLAKMASEYRKPNGTTIVTGKRINEFLQHLRVRDIPGVGGNREALLNKFSIHTAADFANASEREIKRLLGKSGTDLWHELQGTSIYAVASQPQLPKSVSRTASMGQLTQDRAVIHSHLLRHAMRLSKELIEKRLTTRNLIVMLTLKSFEKQLMSALLSHPTADYFLLAEAAGKALQEMFDLAQSYRACGLIATEIAPGRSDDFDLFQQVEKQREEKHVRLLETMHDVNHKYGGNVLSIAAAVKSVSTGAVRFNYPMLECV
jgi:nucleotidyltransferase/DNA polymerase involved in DNA repair